MMNIKLITFELLKPSDLPTMDLLKMLEQEQGVSRIDIGLMEFERNTETLKVEIQGKNLNVDALLKIISDFGGVVQNVEHIVAEKA